MSFQKNKQHRPFSISSNFNLSFGKIVRSCRSLRHWNLANEQISSVSILKWIKDEINGLLYSLILRNNLVKLLSCVSFNFPNKNAT